MEESTSLIPAGSSTAPKVPQAGSFSVKYLGYSVFTKTACLLLVDFSWSRIWWPMLVSWKGKWVCHVMVLSLYYCHVELVFLRNYVHCIVGKFPNASLNIYVWCKRCDAFTIFTRMWYDGAASAKLNPLHIRENFPSKSGVGAINTEYQCGHRAMLYGR